VGRPILERSLRGVIAARPARALAEAARLAFAELDQAEVDLADLQGRDVGRVVVGAMPLSRACIMGPAIARFRTLRPKVPIRIVDGPFDSLALGLRRGEIDVLVGALRPAATVPEFEQTALFEDVMAIVGRPGHPALYSPAPDLPRLAGFPWVLTPPGTPARFHFDAMFAAPGTVPESLVETGSLVLMREILRQSDHLGFVSSQQVATEVETGMLARLDWPLGHTARPIGLITRRGWVPTRVQSDLIDCIGAVSRGRQG
jgi:LysR family transcriptional regulator, regulator for genes of the gallate degradation pathway